MRKHLPRLAITIQVDEQGEFDGKALVNESFLPLPDCPPWIPPPRNLPLAPSDADHVHVAVHVDIEQQVAEVVDVVVPEMDGTEFLALEVRPAIPILPRDDIEESVAVEVGDGAGLVAPEIDDALAERNLLGWPYREARSGQEGSKESRRHQVPHHDRTMMTQARRPLSDVRRIQRSK